MTCNKQTFIHTYFKVVPKLSNSYKSTVHSITNMKNMEGMNQKQMNTLKQMKDIVNEYGLNSIKLPFLLPSFNSDFRCGFGRRIDVTVSTNNNEASKTSTLKKFSDEPQNRIGKKKIARKKPSLDKTRSPIKKSPSKQLNKNVVHNQTLLPLNFFKELAKEKQVDRVVRTKTLAPVKLFDESPKKQFVDGETQNTTSPPTKESATNKENEKEVLDKTLSSTKEPMVSKEALNRTLSPVKSSDNANKVQILNSTVLTRNESIPLHVLTAVKHTGEKNTTNIITKPESPTKVKVNVTTEPVVKKEGYNTLVLDYVKQIIKYVASHQSLKKLLTGREVTTLNKFLRLPTMEYTYFCIRLYTRKRRWYNIFKLRTQLNLSICDRETMDMYACLSENEFVDTDYSSEPIETLLKNLLVFDIKYLCTKFKLSLPRYPTKDVMIEKLLLYSIKQRTLTFSRSMKEILLEEIKQKLGQCVRINTEFYKILHKIHLMYRFVTHDFQKVSDLYLFMGEIKHGAIVMPQITVNENYNVFSSIFSFSCFQKAYELREDVIAAIENKCTDKIYDLCSVAYEELRIIVESNIFDDRPSCIRRFTPGHQYASALSTGIKHLTKHNPNEVSVWLEFLIQQDIYCKTLTGVWYNTLIMVQYSHLKQKEKATDTLIKALQETKTEIDLADLNVRAEKIKHSQTHKIARSQFGQISALQPISIKDFPFVEVDSKAIRSEVSGKKRNYFEKSENGLEFISVEEVALRYYFRNDFANGLHCEGTLLVSIFFILFWDIIYGNEVPYAFISEIQYYPLDLNTKDFYVQRQGAIDKRLSEIESDWPLSKLNELVCNIWDNHSLKKSFINSDIVNEPEQLCDILLCIGRLKLRKIMERLVMDFKSHRSGLPDLFLWNVKKKKCKFVEVKGENDKLSSKQKCWLDFLRTIGAEIEVCHVHTMGSKRKFRKAKTEKKKEDETPKKKKT